MLVNLLVVTYPHSHVKRQSSGSSTTTTPTQSWQPEYSVPFLSTKTKKSYNSLAAQRDRPAQQLWHQGTRECFLQLPHLQQGMAQTCACQLLIITTQVYPTAPAAR